MLGWSLIWSFFGVSRSTLISWYIALHKIRISQTRLCSWTNKKTRLWGPELRYQRVEKMVLAFVIAARRLSPYFLSHQIVVRTNQHLRQILQHRLTILFCHWSSHRLTSIYRSDIIKCIQICLTYSYDYAYISFANYTNSLCTIISNILHDIID